MTLSSGTTARLTEPQRYLLWRIAQHKYGWVGCPNMGSGIRRLQTARALECRGLVKVGGSAHDPTAIATEAGRAEIARLWPVSPFILRTYDSQPGGWTPPEGVTLLSEDPIGTLTSGTTKPITVWMHPALIPTFKAWLSLNDLHLADPMTFDPDSGTQQIHMVLPGAKP